MFRVLRPEKCEWVIVVGYLLDVYMLINSYGVTVFKTHEGSFLIYGH
jgi:hypothetical protein